MIMILSFVFALSLFRAVAAALVNFTVDDNDSLITYTGTWEPASAHLSGLDFGGGHAVSTDSGASAVFTFTGVAIYYLAPRWPYAVTTQLSLDGAPGIVVNLTDPDASPTTDGSESALSSIVWAATGLLNATHTLVVTMANSGQFIIVDALIYTVDVSSTPPHASSVSAAASAASASTFPPIPGTPDPHGVSSIPAIALGITFGAAVLGAAAFLVWFVLYRPLRARRRSNVLDEWGVAQVPMPGMKARAAPVDAAPLCAPPAYSAEAPGSIRTHSIPSH